MFDRITFNPDVMGGQPCIRGMGIPVSIIVGGIAHGADFDEILAGHPGLEREDVRQAVEYAAWLTEQPVVATISGEAEGRPVSNGRLEAEFEALACQWKDATRYSSSTTEISTHPAYQRIIGMGRGVLPLIVRQLRQSPDHWFWALKALTGEDPVSPTDRGNISAMTEAWLEWADRY
jgi:uncharacterized protein (DUF433 family)